MNWGKYYLNRNLLKDYMKQNGNRLFKYFKELEDYNKSEGNLYLPLNLGKIMNVKKDIHVTIIKSIMHDDQIYLSITLFDNDIINHEIINDKKYLKIVKTIIHMLFMYRFYITLSLDLDKYFIIKRSRFSFIDDQNIKYHKKKILKSISNFECNIIQKDMKLDVMELIKSNLK